MVWYILFFYCMLETFESVVFFACFPIRFWKRSDIVVYLVFLLDFGNVSTLWYFSLFYQILETDFLSFSNIFWKRSNIVEYLVFLLDFGSIPPSWQFFSIKFGTVFLLYFGSFPSVQYFLFYYQILETFQQCGIFLSFFYQNWKMFRQCGVFLFSIRVWKCSDSVVFFVFLLDF